MKGAGRRKSRRVRGRAAEPKWLTRAQVDAIHAGQLREHGGRQGVRGEGPLDSALHRPKNKFAYGKHHLSMMASAYAFGIAKNRAFLDGNKRTAFMAAYIFLSINDRKLEAPEPEVVDVMNRLAAGRISEAAFADWIQAHITPT